MTEKKDELDVRRALDDDELDQVSGGAFTSEYSDAEYWAAGVMPVSWAGIFNYKYVLQTSGEELGWIEAGEAVIFLKFKGRKANNLAEIKNFMKNDFPRIIGDDGHGGLPH